MKTFQKYILLTLSILFSSFFSYGQSTVRVNFNIIEDEMTEEQKEIIKQIEDTNGDLTVIFKGKNDTLYIDQEVKIKNNKVIFNVSNIIAFDKDGKIKIENDKTPEEFPVVTIRQKDFYVDAKVEIKNANTTIKSEHIITSSDSHLKFETGILTSNNCIWDMDGHVDFQAHGEDAGEDLIINMNNVVLNELSDKIHYKDHLDWNFNGGCISAPNEEDLSTTKHDNRPPGYTNCSNDHLIDYDGNVTQEGTTVIKWDIYLEDSIDHYYLETSTNQNDWTPIHDKEAKGENEGSPLLTYNYSDQQSRSGEVFFQLRAEDKTRNTVFDSIITIMYDEDLPVELIYFEAEVFEEGPSLFWATATEINSAYFEVQYSYNQYDWTTLDQIEASGNSNITIEYQYDDIKRSGTVFYRLKQVDLDGKYEYFGPIKVIIDDNSELEIKVFPVPQQAGQSITIVPNNNESYDLYIFNHIGQTVYIEEDLQDQTELSTPWGRGVFIIHLLQENKKVIKKFQLN